jgi:hypothetical protein
MPEKSVWNWNMIKSNEPPAQLILPTSARVTFDCLAFSKEKLQEQELSTSDKIIETIIAIFNDVALKELQREFSEWIQRITWVIEREVGCYDE